MKALYYRVAGFGKLYNMDPHGAGYELVKDKKPCRDDNAVLL